MVPDWSMDIASFAHVPALPRGCIQGVQGVVKPETGFNVTSQFLKFSVGVTGNADLLEIEGLLTQGSPPGRTFGESVGGIFVMGCSDWSNGIRYHIFEYQTRY